MLATPHAAEPRRLSDFIRERHAQILSEWEAAVRRMRPARELSRPVLLDHIPDFLRELSQYVGNVRDGQDVTPSQELPTIHAIERLDLGYDLTEVVAEYGALRTCISALAAREGTPALRSAELPRLHEAIDQAIATSVSRYSHARERTLKALDRITTAALGASDLEGFLPKTLAVLLETTATVDSVSILLIEDEELRVKASVGLAMSPADAVPLRKGECFAGHIWQVQQPQLLRNAAEDPRVTTDTIRRAGTRALYGVPLQLGSEIIGVALMGSCTTHDFSHEDLLLFRTAVARAASLIAQARLQEDREAKHRELTQSVAFRDQIMSVLGHDLRQPLHVIATSASLLLRKEGLEEHAPIFTRLLRNVERIDRMIRDLLDYSRARQGAGLPMKPERIDLLPLIQQSVEAIELLHPDRQVEVTHQGDPTGLFDGDRLLQVFGNLLGNAAAYSPKGSRIEVKVDADSAAVRIAVCNAGTPIPPEVLPSIFEPFRRGGAAGNAGGLGLGLFIVREIVLAHGGSVTVDSTPENGTCFRIALPKAPP